MRVLPIRPNIFRFFFIFCQRESRPTVLFYDALDGAPSVEEGSFRGTLEFEEEAVFFGPFAFGLAVEVRGVHEFVVQEFDAF